MEKKKSIFKKWWFWVIIVVVIGGIAAAGGGSKDEKNKNTGKENVKNEESKGKPADTEKEEPQDVTEPYEITLKAGCYTVGVDIPEELTH